MLKIKETNDLKFKTYYHDGMGNDKSCINLPYRYTEKVPVSIGKYKKISYETGKTGSYEFSKYFHNCTHLKSQASKKSWPSSWPYAPAGKLDTPWCGDPLRTQMTPDLTKPSSTLKAKWDSVCSDFSAEAWSNLQPSLEGELEGTNFLLELVELKELFTLIPNILTKVRDGKLAKAWAEGHLGTQFGLLPFVDDIKIIYTTISTYHDYLNSFKENAGKPQKAYYTKTFEDSSTIMDRQLTHLKSYHEYEIRGKSTAIMFYTYYLPDDFHSLTSKLGQFLDRFGLYLDLNVLWEAIPFSFVVDWFFDISSFLKQYRRTYTKIPSIMHDFSLSMNAIEKITYFYNRYASSCHAEVNAPMYTYTQTWYVRQRHLPNTGTFFNPTSRFGEKQALLSAALLISNVR